uniref:ABC transporter domain-containing protein n=1 Tax=Bionectria ochroleuca TaxID=29856 RepID=A0A8H7NKK4_BIOOC
MSYSMKVDKVGVETTEMSLSGQNTPYNPSSRDNYQDTDLIQLLQGGLVENNDSSPVKSLGVSYENLTVRGVEASVSSVETLPKAIWYTFGPGLWHLARRMIPIIPSTTHSHEIIHSVTGNVQPGEIMLVLGRPGSGCSTFLKAIANQRKEYAAVEGDVRYGGITAEEQKRHFRGEVVYCEEDDRHFASLTAWQTLWFALTTKTKRRERENTPIVIDVLLRVFKMRHVSSTLIGDEHLRGLSGGERKRISLAEILATRAAVECWDNSTRGLDASTALSFVEALRAYTDLSGRTTLISLYQASESIYNLVNKVIVFDQGRVIYQGPAQEAKKYFVDLGYYCPPRQTTADFLTSIGDINNEKFQQGREDCAHKSPQELEDLFRRSSHHQRILEDARKTYNLYHNGQTNLSDLFRSSIHQSKSRRVSPNSPYTISYVRQVAACIKRQLWLMWYDRNSFYVKLATIIVNALVIGSLFSEVDPGSTDSTFARSGMTFISVGFIGWIQFAELKPSIEGRTILERQRQFSFCRPSAVVVGRAVLDLLAMLIMTSTFSLAFYFLAQYQFDAGKFWTYFLFVYTGGFTLTALYRMLAAFSNTVDDAILYVGILMNVMFIYTGYNIPRNTLINDVPWFGWFAYINPLTFAFEAVLTSEMAGISLKCNQDQLVPRGKFALEGFQGCGIPGAGVGSTTVDGLAFLSAAFDFHKENIWRNLGILFAFSIAFIVVNVVAVDMFRLESADTQSTVYAKPNQEAESPKVEDKGPETDLGNMGYGNHVFTFKDLEYIIPYGHGEKKLLHGVTGYVKPGQMVALIGTSGAGKSTLLNTLSFRHRLGTVSGTIAVDGKRVDHIGKSEVGFCEQRDVHEGSATVLEALRFSALLRQDRRTSRAEKLAYVDRLIDLLEFNELKHALVSSLDIEQRKRVTIGVELAAKPSMLLFLDEPTSGLDSQSAYSVVRFLRKLADSGQAIICTIHQPSSDLIEQFDSILALNLGGNTSYFGPIGDNGSVVVDYFAARGSRPAPAQNIAEFILETTSRAASSVKNDQEPIHWDEEWRKSGEADRVAKEIDRYAALGLENAQTRELRVESFPASTFLQCQLLTKRTFVKYWREPHYFYGRIFIHLIMGTLVGFTFRDSSNSIASVQNRMLSSIIMPFFMTAPVVNSVVSNFFTFRELWEDRELPSGTYSWVAFCTANIIAEIPISMLAGTIYFILWYFPSESPIVSSVSGYAYALTILWALFMPSFGHWIGAFGPTYQITSNILPCFFVGLSLITTTFTPWQYMPAVWKYTVYYMNPVTWYSRGILSTVLPLYSIQCSQSELARFNPPLGSTCAEYAGHFVSEVATSGYLQNPNETSNCGFCQYQNGLEYIETLNIHNGDQWLALGLMAVFVVLNWALLFFFVYTVRFKGWTFGIAHLKRFFFKAKRSFKRTSKGDDMEV